MSDTKADILLHPIRLRIVLALASEQHMTTAQIAGRLPDVAHATLYRHVAVLADEGLLEVVDEQRVRGGIERTYALVSDAAQLGPEDVAEMSPDEQLRGFAVFAASLVDAFGRYLSGPQARAQSDLVGYRQIPLWLGQGEQAELVERMRSAVGPALENGPAPGRQRVLLSTILFPEPSPPTDPEPSDQR